MIRFYCDTFTFEEEGKLQVSVNKKFITLPVNSFAKYDVALFKVEDRFYLCENVSISTLEKHVNIYVSGKMFKTVKGKPDNIKKLLRKTKKYFRFYDNKFQIGLHPSELQMLFESRSALVRFKLMKKYNFSIGEEVTHA